jgi:hypothetical protein
MLRLGPGKEYPLCLLDTNAVSAIVKNPDREFRHYLSWSMRTPSMYVPSFSVFTVLELRHSPAVYEKFLELFTTIPCVMLKSFDQLVEDEVRSYPDPSEIDPCLIAFAGPLARAGLGEVLDAHFATNEGVELERKWNDARDEIVDGIRSLVANYPPDAGTYSHQEVRTFVEVAGFEQVAMRHLEFAKAKLEDGEAVEIDAFPSVKAASYTVFHKFYADAHRNPTTSDAFDIIISAATPYVEAIITESHQAEVLRKTKRRDDFIKDLGVFALRDFRDAPP